MEGVLEIGQGDVLTDVGDVVASRLEEVMHKEEAELLSFAFGKVDQELGRIFGDWNGQLVDCDDEFLAYEETDEVFLHRIDGTGEPEYAEFVEKGEDDFEHGPFEADLPDIGGDDAIELPFVHFHHGKGKGVELGIGFEIDLRESRHFFDDFVVAHFGDLGDLDPVFIEQGDVEDAFEVFVLIVPDIRRRTFGFDDAIALLPYP